MTGITRGLDDLGRVVIPKELRRKLAIRFGDEIDFTLEGTSIRLSKVTVGCRRCGCTNKAKLKTLDDVTLCTDCIEEFGE